MTIFARMCLLLLCLFPALSTAQDSGPPSDCVARTDGSRGQCGGVARVVERRSQSFEDAMLDTFSTEPQSAPLDLLPAYSATGNQSAVVQNGQNNDAFVFMEGQGNRAFVQQVGDGNQSSVDMRGTDLGVAVVQQGDQNLSDIGVSGRNLLVEHSQIGNSLSYSMDVEGSNKTIRVNQTGQVSP